MPVGTDDMRHGASKNPQTTFQVVEPREISVRSVATEIKCMFIALERSKYCFHVKICQ